MTTLIAFTVAAALLLLIGVVIGRQTAGNQPVANRSTAAPSITTAPIADMAAPEFDVPGEDIPGLPRFPGMTRVEYRQVILGELLETEVEYVMEGTLEPIHDFYRQVFEDEGWSVGDLHIFQGEWTFFVIQDDREALVELESRGPLVEVEIELTEPVPTQMSDVTAEP